MAEEKRIVIWISKIKIYPTLTFWSVRDPGLAIPWFHIRSEDGWVDEYREIDGEMIHNNPRPEIGISLKVFN